MIGPDQIKTVRESNRSKGNQTNECTYSIRAFRFTSDIIDPDEVESCSDREVIILHDTCHVKEVRTASKQCGEDKYTREDDFEPSSEDDGKRFGSKNNEASIQLSGRRNHG